jgi:hypothetical protein
MAFFEAIESSLDKPAASTTCNYRKKRSMSDKPEIECTACGRGNYVDDAKPDGRLPCYWCGTVARLHPRDDDRDLALYEAHRHFQDTGLMPVPAKSVRVVNLSSLGKPSDGQSDDTPPNQPRSGPRSLRDRLRGKMSTFGVDEAVLRERKELAKRLRIAPEFFTAKEESPGEPDLARSKLRRIDELCQTYLNAAGRSARFDEVGKIRRLTAMGQAPRVDEKIVQQAAMGDAKAGAAVQDATGLSAREIASVMGAVDDVLGEHGRVTSVRVTPKDTSPGELPRFEVGLEVAILRPVTYLGVDFSKDPELPWDDEIDEPDEPVDLNLGLFQAVDEMKEKMSAEYLARNGGKLASVNDCPGCGFDPMYCSRGPECPEREDSDE